ncbi:universal stress protein [Denitromonas ohlonensis]|uniref:Universal stress protein UspA n=2 Tax=Denitromonas TaxID=139331 RepID=A0A557S9Q0_9RHOO|nr:universal stress protein [Denitromonas ohlonensis]TVO63602.1 universal stress protein UspA [Denitromonas ohlonensis]TVO74136.1 universal stress protein UspA [Denitromonas ohlonensis]
MYRHLLVPIDGTDLSTATISQAVEFARALGARITFFHAQPDFSASLSGDAEVVRLTAPADFVYAYQGRARELLTKAESAARAHGVPCASSSAVSDNPYSAIVAMARESRCDLIYMASHGRKSTLGMLLGSQTLKVLLHSEIPVLVAATTNPPAPIQAIGIIREEHRSLAAVLHAWQHLLKRASEDNTTADPDLMRAMLRYIQAFPLALHHPKEDEYLFRLLRERTHTMNAELDELERQHTRDHQLVAELSDTLERHIAGQAALADLDRTVSSYAQFIWEHMGREEGVILPAAQRYLTDADWNEINAAFSENRDPRFSGDTDAEFKRLFSRIVNIALPANH